MSRRRVGISGPYLRASRDSFGLVVWMIVSKTGAEVFAAGGVLEGPLPRIRDLRLWVGGMGGGSLAL